MPKAVFLDVDGTLLTSAHTLSPATVKAIRELDRRNIRVVLVTARPPAGVYFLYDALGISHNPMICFNGGCIMRGTTLLSEATILAVVSLHILRETRQFAINTNIYHQQAWYTSAIDYWVRQEQAITGAQVEESSLENILSEWQLQENGPHKVLCMGEAAEINRTEAHLSQLALPDVNVYKSKPTYLEITHVHASKPKAIDYLLAIYGIAREEILAIGDNYNDREMIEMAGTGIAMGNAPDEIKKVAHYVTDTNDNDGVANALARFCELS